jgi:hypothetical protein
MARLAVLLLLAALPVSLAWSPPVVAQSARPAVALSAAQAERKSVDLKQGMSLEAVEELLGKPRRTALKNGGSAGGSLQWTYAWPGAASSQGTLNVVFGAKTPDGAKTAEQWYVSGWEWSTY